MEKSFKKSSEKFLQVEFSSEFLPHEIDSWCPKEANVEYLGRAETAAWTTKSKHANGEHLGEQDDHLLRNERKKEWGSLFNN